MKMEFTESNLGKAHGLLEMLFARTVAQEMAIRALMPLNFHSQAVLANLAQAQPELLPANLRPSTLALIQQNLQNLATPLPTRGG